MNHFIAACLQMQSGINVKKNIQAVEELAFFASQKRGAKYVQTPEMTNIIQQDKEALLSAITPEATAASLEALSKMAQEFKIWLHIGSMAVLANKSDQLAPIANRAFVFDPNGKIRAQYDKIHMFDVDLDHGESWRESTLFRPSNEAQMLEMQIDDANAPKLGLAICYDLRFPSLLRTYAQNGAHIIGTPAAFTKQTGEAHWHILQRARAIENGAFMISANQGGHHEDGRDTYGHSIIIDPWGETLAEADHDEVGFITAEIDLAKVGAARSKIPALTHDRNFTVVTQ